MILVRGIFNINFIPISQITLKFEIPRGLRCNPSVVNIQEDLTSLQCRSLYHQPIFSLSYTGRSMFESEKISPDPHQSECDTAYWDLSSSRFSGPQFRPLLNRAPTPVIVNLF